MLLFSLSLRCRMVAKAALTLVLLSKLILRSPAAPARDNDFGIESLDITNSLTKASQHSISLFRSSPEHPRTSIIQAYDIETLLLSPPYKPSSSTTIQADRTTSPLSSFSYSESHTFTQSVPSIEPYPKTITVTEEIPTTITVSANPATVTEILFPPPISMHNAPSRTSTAGLGPAKSIWLAPTDLSDLSAFQVSKFAGGQKNMKFVENVPAEAKRPDEVVSSDDRDNSVPPSTTLLQLRFPAGSIDPGNKPQGGAEFYASPIDITTARNVTFQYSVFFPLDFNFVLAGKLPGLYGGHTGCSGGDPAVDCFSTRLMWREGGAGELYLYAPKTKQSDELCKAEGSVCDEMYGFSIGRGSFSWNRGDWTTIKQTVFLNTPGEQDGVFILDVNGKAAIHRSDILYREGAEKSGGKGKVKHKTATKHTRTKLTAVTTTATETPTSSSDDDGDLLGLGPLLSSLLGGLRREVDPGERRDDAVITTTVLAAEKLSPTPALVAKTPLPTKTPVAERSLPTDVKFVGIFFSTFFGGHDDKYATPRDQYVWFKDFGLAYNA